MRPLRAPAQPQAELLRLVRGDLQDRRPVPIAPGRGLVDRDRDRQVGHRHHPLVAALGRAERAVGQLQPAAAMHE
jgi:hypothetical protein